MSEPFRMFTSKVVPLPAENVDINQRSRCNQLYFQYNGIHNRQYYCA